MSLEEKKPKYIASLTPLRGIAAMMVAILHLSDGFYPGIDTKTFTMLFQKGYLWVDFFFILSGFILTHVYGPMFLDRFSWRDYVKFLYVRITRIYPVLLLVLFGFFLLEVVKLWYFVHTDQVLLSPPFTAEKSPIGLLTSALMIQSWGIHEHVMWNPPSWSMSVEWAAYLLYPTLAFVLFRQSQRETVLWLMILLISIFVFCSIRGSLNVIQDLGLIRCLISFSIGMLVYRIYAWRWIIDSFSQSLVSFTAMLFLIVVMHFDWFDAVCIPLFAALILSTAHNHGTMARALNVRPLVFLGDISYSLYMTHFLLLEFGGRAFRVLVGQNVWDMDWSIYTSIFALGVSLSMAIFVAWLTYRFFERPAQNYLRKQRIFGVV